jgi:hypothetical protein
MLGVTIMGLFLTPTFYVVLRGLAAWRRRAAEERLAATPRAIDT